MKNNLYDTIAAISTPAGEGGISVLRLSGENAFSLTEKVFSKDNSGIKKIDFQKTASHTIHFGYIFDNADITELIDEVLISVFKGPNSYTGENVVEISSHGGFYIAQKILSVLINTGARHAEPGEFTKRAFLNGRIDLSQAEAVADLIKAKTDSAHSSSIKQLEGALSEFAHKTRQEIINITSLVELELDFAEEGLEFVKADDIKSLITNLNSKLRRITESYIAGKVIRDGVNLVIAGKPNSGKSSLFNYLLNKNRAIVSSVAGTTRDYIEENIIINGVLFNLTDTAGLRSSDDEIESEGIRRSFSKIDEADMILYLTDSSEDEKFIEDDIANFENNFEKERSVLVFSKCDLKKVSSDKGTGVSLLNEETLENLKRLMSDKVKSAFIPFSKDEIVLTNIRHKFCLENVIRSLEEAITSVENKMSGEFISVDLRNALNHLGEITGEVTNDTILNNIFMNFCIGK